jgi:hypothetical protein
VCVFRYLFNAIKKPVVKVLEDLNTRMPNGILGSKQRFDGEVNYSNRELLVHFCE